MKGLSCCPRCGFEWEEVAEHSRRSVPRDDEKKEEDGISRCADPDFSDFETLREKRLFRVGQTWAMYDDVGQMPRYYMR